MNNRGSLFNLPGFKRVCLGGAVASVALAGSLVAGVAYADASYPAAFDLRHYDGTVTYDAGMKQNVITGGINYVSPVKRQTPFSTCWAFSACAASETSLLTALDKADDGLMNGSVDYEKAASGQAGKLAQAASDLSEKHLALGAFSHPLKGGTYSSQAGEGNYLISGSTVASDLMDASGMVTYGMSAFSAGVGPIAESLAPYTGGKVEVLSPDSVVTKSDQNLVYEYFDSYEEAKAWSDGTWTDEVISEFNEKNGTAVDRKTIQPMLSKKGDWSLPQKLTYGALAELSNSNILETTRDDGLTDNEISAMKRELSEGHPVSVGFSADQSRPGQRINAKSSYINTQTWAQYTYESAVVNHAVTVVGYDDDYDKSNFTHDQYKTDESGDLVLDEKRTAMTTPEGNGAWIVKNSWGSADNEDPLAVNDWGVDGSGYFYLSYYDKTITRMESFEFDVSDEAQQRLGYSTAQYDLAMNNGTESVSSKSVTRMCNVFGGDGKEGDSGEAFAIRDLGCMTSTPNATVTMDLYVMEGNADVTEALKGQPTATVTETFDSAGFHRLHLGYGVVARADQKVAAVQTTVRSDDSYEYQYGYGINKELAEKYNELYGAGINAYGKTVVNKGESLIFLDGSWKDWTEQIKVINENSVAETAREMRSMAAENKEQAKQCQEQAKQYQTMAEQYPEGSADYAKYAQLAQQAQAQAAQCLQTAEKAETFNVSVVNEIDNFSIKLYGDEVEVPDTPPAKAAASQKITGKTSKTMTYKAAKKGKYAKKLSKAKTVKSLKGTFGLKAKTGMTFKLSSVTKAAKKFVTVSKSGKVTIKKGLKRGTFTVKVKVSAAKSSAYKAATKTIVLKIRIK